MVSVPPSARAGASSWNWISRPPSGVTCSVTSVHRPEQQPVGDLSVLGGGCGGPVRSGLLRRRAGPKIDCVGQSLNRRLPAG
jgi:hypothetical protein